MDIWQESIPVRFASVDCSNRLTLGAAFGFFQEAAISHASVLGVGTDAMKKNGHAWLLSRFSVFFETRPFHESPVIVRSWPRGPKKLFILRDYDIQDNSGKALVRGRASWLVIDIEKHRPVRVEPVAEKLPLNEGVDAFHSTPPALVQREELVPAGERQAAYSDIDFYGHVNNVRYVQWIQDITPPELLNKAAQIRFDINYLNETLPGEKVTLHSTSIDTAVPAGESSGDYPHLTNAAFAYEGRRYGNSDLSVFRAELRLGF